MTIDDVKKVAHSSSPGGGRLDETTAGGSDPIFRIVTFKGRKHGFKLEPIFWKIIRLAAGAEQKRIGAYVEHVLANVGERDNMTSVLRAHAAEWLSAKFLDAASKALSLRSLTKMVQAIPMPCFAMDVNFRITSQNQQFIELLSRHLPDGALGRQEVIRIRFQTEGKMIRDALDVEQKPFVEDVLIIRSQTGSLDRRVRLTAINSADGALRGFLVFVLS